MHGPLTDVVTECPGPGRTPSCAPTRSARTAPRCGDRRKGQGTDGLSGHTGPGVRTAAARDHDAALEYGRSAVTAAGRAADAMATECHDCWNHSASHVRVGQTLIEACCDDGGGVAAGRSAPGLDGRAARRHGDFDEPSRRLLVVGSRGPGSGRGELDALACTSTALDPRCQARTKRDRCLFLFLLRACGAMRTTPRQAFANVSAVAQVTAALLFGPRVPAAAGFCVRGIPK